MREARITLRTLTRIPTAGMPLVIALDAEGARRVRTLGTPGIAIAVARVHCRRTAERSTWELSGDCLRHLGPETAPSLGATGPVRRTPSSRVSPSPHGGGAPISPAKGGGFRTRAALLTLLHASSRIESLSWLALHVDEHRGGDAIARGQAT